MATYTSSRTLWLTALSVGAAISLIAAAAGPLRPGHAEAAAPAFALGMYDTSAPSSFSTVSSLETQMQVHMRIIHWYGEWGTSSTNVRNLDPTLLSATSARGSIPFITWEPWDVSLPVTQQTFPLKAIAAGQFDTYVDTWATGLRNYGQPVLLTFAQEMQGNWYPWGYGVNGNTAADYINAYRHVHDRFTTDGATNVEWVWTADADDAGSPYPASTNFYPGDAYADWMGVDAYNFGTTQTWSSWRSLSDALGLTYQRFTQLNSTKPLILSEWASAEAGGSKPQWLLDAATALQQSFPRVQAAVWFNEHNTQWQLDSSTQSLTAAGQAFRQLSSPGCIGSGAVPVQSSTSSTGAIIRMGTLSCLVEVAAAASAVALPAPPPPPAPAPPPATAPQAGSAKAAPAALAAGRPQQAPAGQPAQGSPSTLPGSSEDAPSRLHPPGTVTTLHHKRVPARPRSLASRTAGRWTAEFAAGWRFALHVFGLGRLWLAAASSRL
jgi:hypothetical protein